VVLRFLRSSPSRFMIQWLSACAMAIWSTVLCSPALSADEIAIIVNENGPLTHISRAEVRDIYLGEIRFVEGFRIVPLHCPEGPAKHSFLSTIIGLSSKAYKLHWAKKVFQEGLTLPPIKADPSDIVKWVKEQPGGIGYVPKELAEMDRGIRILDTIEIIEH